MHDFTRMDMFGVLAAGHLDHPQHTLKTADARSLQASYSNFQVIERSGIAPGVADDGVGHRFADEQSECVVKRY